MERDFERWKRQSEQKLDYSKKGNVDSDIVPLVCLINSRQEYFTTSSCSGRVILIDTSSENSDVQKQNCVWLFVSHQKCTSDQLIDAVSKSSGDAVLKFEPFVLHVQCCRLEDAQLMHSVAINSGFRNSGLTVGKTGKIISAVRSTHSLEVPLSHQGALLVSHDYILFLCEISNQKMEENLRRINRFYENLQTALTTADLPKLQLPECSGAPQPHCPNGDRAEEETEQKVYRRRRKREQKDNRKYTSDSLDGADCSLMELNDCLDLFTPS